MNEIELDSRIYENLDEIKKDIRDFPQKKRTIIKRTIGDYYSELVEIGILYEKILEKIELSQLEIKIEKYQNLLNTLKKLDVDIEEYQLKSIS